MTSLFGALAGFALFLHGAGVQIGHIGNTDFITLAAALGTAALGFAAADATKQNTNTTAITNLVENQNARTLRKLNPDGSAAPRDPVTVIQEK